MSDLRVVYPRSVFLSHSEICFFGAIAAIGVRTSTFSGQIFGIVATPKCLVHLDSRLLQEAFESSECDRLLTIDCLELAI